MNCQFFIYPFVEAGKYGYASKRAGAAISRVYFRNVYKQLYVFCKIGMEECFRQMLKTILQLNPRNFKVVDGSVEIFQVNKIHVATTSGFISYLDSNFNDDCIHRTTLYILKADTPACFESLRELVRCIEISFRYIYTFCPSTTEQVFLMCKLFESKSTEVENIDGLSITVINPAFKLGGETSVCNLYSPTGMYSTLTSGDVIERFTLMSDKSRVINNFRRVPLVTIQVVSREGEETFSPNDEIVLLTVSITFGTVTHFIHIFVNEFPNSLKYDFRDASSTNQRLFIECKTEAELLEQFLYQYIAGDLFFKMGIGSGQMHYLCGDDCEKRAIWIFERFFKNKITGICSFLKSNAGVISIHPSAIVCNIKCSTQGRTPYQTYERYLSDLVKGMPGCKISSEVVNVTKEELLLKSSSLERYKTFHEKRLMALWTIIGLARVQEEISETFINDFNKRQIVMGMLNESEETNISIAMVNVASRAKKAEMRIFLSFLERGVFLISNNRCSKTSIVNLSPTLSIETTPRQMPKKGGYVFSRGGAYKNVAHVDFTSFYPSIISAFQLTYGTVEWVSEQDFKLIEKTHGELLKDRIDIFTLDEGDFVLLKLRKSFTGFRAEYSSFGIHLMAAKYNNLRRLCSSSTNLHNEKDRIDCIDRMERVERVERLERLERSTLASNNYKTAINSVVGCLGDEKFAYGSVGLNSAVTYIGRRLLQFIISQFDLWTGRDFNVEFLIKLFYTFDMKSAAQPSKRIINAQTDGFSFEIKQSSPNATNPDTVVARINQFCQRLTETNDLACSLKFTTDFMLDVCKQSFYYKSGGGGGGVGGGAIFKGPKKHSQQKINSVMSDLLAAKIDVASAIELLK